MSFLFPAFLWALLTLAIPIIIHLFHFRRYKTVYFTNVKFLKEVEEEKNSRRKLRNILVLIARCVALAALVFAFAQPFIPAKNAASFAGRKDVSVYIDNSFSMSSSSEDVPLLEKAKQRAMEIVGSFEVDDRFQVLTCDFEGRDQRLISKEEAIARINEVKLSKSVRTISQAISRQKQALRMGTADLKQMFVVSDFQKNITDLKPSPADSSYTLNLVPLQSVQVQNIAIDSAWFETPVQIPNQTNSLVVKVRNYKDTDAENVALSLSVNGSEKPAGLMSIPAGGVGYDTINVSVLQTGWHQAEVKITDYPVEFDDRFFFTFNVKDKIDILQLHGGVSNRFIDAAFANNPYFKCQPMNVNQLNYSALPDFELIIMADVAQISSGLSASLAQYVKNGGNVILFPAMIGDVNSYKAFCESINAAYPASFEKVTRQASTLNYEEFVFKNVYLHKRENVKLPETKGNYKIARTANSNEEPLISYRDGSSLLAKYKYGKGNFYLCASPLAVENSNIVQNGEVFVPMLYKMSLAKGVELPISYTIGKDQSVETENRVSAADATYKLKSAEGEFIPEQRSIGDRVILNLNNAVKDAGYYDLFLVENQVLDKFAFNYDRRESDLSFYNTDDLASMAGENVGIFEGSSANDFKRLVGERSRGTSLWKWFVVLCLIALAVETALLRLWKV